MENESTLQLLSRVVASVDLVALVGRYVAVADRGGRLMAHCPFHPSNSASLVVDPALHICFCLECGEEWGPVDFLMKAASMSYEEAVRSLAADAGIPLPDDFARGSAQAAASGEVTPSMQFAANRFAARHFHSVLLDTDEGRDIGLSYLRERGVGDAMINRFGLGYAIDSRTHFCNAATAAGIAPGVTDSVGLTVTSERGEHFDRFSGRVIFPVYTISGEPVAFGARTLRTSKDVAKYVNSPESAIYSKSNELYGLWQAREAIERTGRVILVEGYLDVISMHQAGLENVVAASGTSLTEGHVALLGRFTRNVTVIFDADAAGVKAAVRSIDMLLAADMEIDIVSLPPGDDPDSFARANSREAIEAYLREHAIDFIRFKLNLASDRIGRDPIERARVVQEILASIATMPDRGRMRAMISRTAFLLKINETTLAAQLRTLVGQRLEQRSRRDSRRRATPLTGGMADMESSDETASAMRGKEEELLGYVVRNAMLLFDDHADSAEEGEVREISVIDYIDSEMQLDSLSFSNPDLAAIFNAALATARADGAAALEAYSAEADRRRDLLVERRRGELLDRAADLRTIEREERVIAAEAEALRNEVYTHLCAMHVACALMAHPDDAIRRGTTRMLRPRTLLSKIHTRNTAVETEQERLGVLLPQALCVVKAAIVKLRIDEITRRLATCTDIDRMRELMASRMALDTVKAALAPYIGDRVIV